MNDKKLSGINTPAFRGVAMAELSLKVKTVIVNPFMFKILHGNNSVVNVKNGHRVAVIKNKKSVYLLIEQKAVCDGRA